MRWEPATLLGSRCSPFPDSADSPAPAFSQASTHTSRQGAEPSGGRASFLPRVPWQKGAPSPNRPGRLQPAFYWRFPGKVGLHMSLFQSALGSLLCP